MKLPSRYVRFSKSSLSLSCIYLIALLSREVVCFVMSTHSDDQPGIPPPSPSPVDFITTLADAYMTDHTLLGESVSPGTSSLLWGTSTLRSDEMDQPKGLYPYGMNVAYFP